MAKWRKEGEVSRGMHAVRQTYLYHRKIRGQVETRVRSQIDRLRSRISKVSEKIQRIEMETPNRRTEIRDLLRQKGILQQELIKIVGEIS
ncbi:MAG: hypothetical protein HZA95_00225 [Candidatus Vogelbacteria bacterium]|nr:hypothetical protein [Candidatus Vogelbacteria bacterium]